MCITTQKMKFSIKDFFSKCDQIRSFCPVHVITRHFSELRISREFSCYNIPDEKNFRITLFGNVKQFTTTNIGLYCNIYFKKLAKNILERLQFLRSYRISG